MKENQHLQPIPEQTVQAIKAGIREVKEVVMPYAVALTPQERQELPKMGEKSTAFVGKAFELAKENPQLCPAFLNMEDFQTDMTDSFGLIGAKTDAVQLTEMLSDLEMLAGSEAFQHSLGFYNYVKLLAHQDVPQARAVYEELKKRFPHGKRTKSDSGKL
ncbi:MAG: hypothetical protein LBT76_00525 [Tannerella sp.]|jgi:hypothetical protein|nr:hypothetical protein [Tannerella sp.]